MSQRRHSAEYRRAMREFKKAHPEVFRNKKRTPRRERGLRQSAKQPHGPVLTVVKDGQVLMPRRYRRALKTLSPQPGTVACDARAVSFPAEVIPPRIITRERVDRTPATKTPKLQSCAPPPASSAEPPEGRTNVKGRADTGNALIPLGNGAAVQR